MRKARFGRRVVIPPAGTGRAVVALGRRDRIYRGVQPYRGLRPINKNGDRRTVGVLFFFEPLLGVVKFIRIHVGVVDNGSIGFRVMGSMYMREGRENERKKKAAPTIIP